MNYLTATELKNIFEIVENLNEAHNAKSLVVGLDVKIYDQNGEILGMVTITEGGEYGFLPNFEDNERTVK